VHVVCKLEMSAVAGSALYWVCVCYLISSVRLLTSGTSLHQVLQWSICRARKWGESVSWFATRTIQFLSRLCSRSQYLQGEINLIFRSECAWMVMICEGDSEFLCNKTNWMHQFHKFILLWNSACYRQFVCPSSAVYSLYTQQWHMSYRFVHSRTGMELQFLQFHPGPARKLSTNLYDTYHCWVYSE